jgi:hypothetical protein
VDTNGNGVITGPGDINIPYERVDTIMQLEASGYDRTKLLDRRTRKIPPERARFGNGDELDISNMFNDRAEILREVLRKQADLKWEDVIEKEKKGLIERHKGNSVGAAFQDESYDFIRKLEHKLFDQVNCHCFVAYLIGTKSDLKPLWEHHPRDDEAKFLVELFDGKWEERKWFLPQFGDVVLFKADDEDMGKKNIYVHSAYYLGSSRSVNRYILQNVNGDRPYAVSTVSEVQQSFTNCSVSYWTRRK